MISLMGNPGLALSLQRGHEVSQVNSSVFQVDNLRITLFETAGLGYQPRFHRASPSERHHQQCIHTLAYLPAKFNRVTRDEAFINVKTFCYLLIERSIKTGNLTARDCILFNEELHKALAFSHCPLGSIQRSEWERGSGSC